MRTFSLVALAALLFSTMAMAGLQELATQMPPCAVCQSPFCLAHDLDM